MESNRTQFCRRGSESANSFGMDFHVSPQMVRSRSSVRAHRTLVGLFLRMSTLVAFHMSRTRRFVVTAGMAATVEVQFLGRPRLYVSHLLEIVLTSTKLFLHG